MCLDLPYEEDSRAEVDLNVVMDAHGDFVEIQGTGENGVFGRDELDEMLDVAQQGCYQLIEAQRAALAKPIGGAGAQADAHDASQGGDV